MVDPPDLPPRRLGELRPGLASHPAAGRKLVDRQPQGVQGVAQGVGEAAGDLADLAQVLAGFVLAGPRVELGRGRLDIRLKAPMASPTSPSAGTGTVVPRAPSPTSFAAWESRRSGFVTRCATTPASIRSRLRPEVVNDEQVGRSQAAQHLVGGVIGSGLMERPEHAIGAQEQDLGAGATGGVSQRAGQEGLAHTDGPHEDDVLAPLEEAEPEQIPDAIAVEGDGAIPVEVLEHDFLLEARA